MCNTAESVNLDGSVALTEDSYFSRYHNSFPVLLPSTSPDAVYVESPLLFWTIIVTAARHDSLDFSLFPALVPVVKKLLWQTIGTIPHILPSLQAMSILCVWTFPASSMPIDITFLLAGILKSAAMHTGLHRPDILTHYSRTRSSLDPAKLREAVKVWCCTYVAIEGCVTLHNAPTLTPFDCWMAKSSFQEAQSWLQTFVSLCPKFLG
jgi:transcriptional regulatory protein LEU3